MMGNGLDRVMQLSSIVDATGNDVDVAAATAAAAQRHVASNAASKGWCSQSDGSVATPDHAHDFHRDDSHSNANDDNDDGGHGLPSSSVNAMHVDTDEDDEDMVFLSGWSRRRSELGKRRRIQELEETDSMADDAASEPAASATTDAADRLVARAGSSKTGYENTRAILLSRLEMLAPTPLYLGDACPLPEPQTAIIASLNADARAMLARSLKSASPDVLLSILVKDIPLKAFDVASTACFEIILRLMPDYGRPNSIRSTYVLTDGQKRAQRDEIASLEADRQRHAILRCSPYVDRWMLLNGMQSWTVKQFTLLYILLFRNVLSKYELFCRQRSSAVNTADAEPTAGLSADDVLQRQLAEKEAIALARRKRRNEMERLRRAAARKARAEAALQQAAANAAGMHSNAMVLHNGVQSHQQQQPHQPHQQQQQQQQQPPPQQQGTANASQANNHNTHASVTATAPPLAHGKRSLRAKTVLSQHQAVDSKDGERSDAAHLMHTLAVHAIPLVEPKTEPAGVDSRGGSECDAAAQAVDASADAGAGVDGSVEPECGSKMSAELDDDTRRKEEQRRLAAQMYNERRRAERARRKAARLSALADAENAGMHDGVGGWTADAAAGSDGANGMGSAGSGTVADAVMSRREAQRELAAQMHNTRRRDSLARTSTATTATEAAVTSGRRTLRSMDSGTHSCVDAYGRAATYGSADDDDDAKQVRTNTAHALHTRPSRHASREASTDTAGCHSGFFDRWGQRRFIINAAALASALQEAETVLLSRSLYGRPDGSDIAEAAMMRVVRGMDGYGWTGVREKGSASGMDGGAATDAVTALRRSSETDCKQRYWPSTKLATPAAESVDRTSVGRPGGSVAVAAEPLYYVHDSPVDVMGSATLSTNGQGQPQQQANAANTAPTTPLKPALVAALSALDMTYLRGLAKSIPDLDLPIASLTAAGQHFVVDTLARMSIMRVVRLAPHGLADGDIPDPVRTDIAAFDAEMSGVVRAIYSRRDDVQVSSDELAVAKSVVEDLAMHGIHAFTSSRVAQSIFGWLSHPSVASWTINQFAALFTKLAAHYATIVQQTHAKIRSVFVDNVRLVGFDAAFAAHNAELSRSRRNRSSLTTSGAMAAGIVAASPALSSNDTVSSVTEPELQVLQPQQAQHEQPTWTRACDSVSDAAITAALTLPPLDTLTGDLTVNQLSRLVGALKATATTVLDSLVAADVDESLAPAPLASSLEHLRARLVPASGSDEHMRAVADEIQAFVDMGPAVYAATRCAEYLDNWQTYPCIAGWSVKHLVVTYAVFVAWVYRAAVIATGGQPA